MRVVAPLLPVKIAAVSRGPTLFRLEALLRCPGFDECPIHSEVLVGHVALGPLHYPLEEAPRRLLIEQSIPVLGEHGGIPHPLVHVHPHEPSEQLRGPAKWTFYSLYVILDVFSRFVVGWMIAYRESAELAKRLIEHTCRKQNISPGQLTVHADRGSSMKSKPVALLQAGLGAVKTHSRPHVSDDNPYSESQFRTLKYRPGFPDRFGSIEDARGFCQSFFNWYNHQHHHSGLGLMTPAAVHFGQATQILAHRQAVLDAAFRAHPERFVRSPPRPPELPSEVWINRPSLDQPPL